ncbi:MAG: tRNA pseudouridine(13) synthase TruD [Gammaproteobacteria bacterium]|nr:tRNA pseudouridine(13) synthase TruD [Gammaproteobacteria bacterium]
MTSPDYRVTADTWPCANGRPRASGVLRAENADFQVEEDLGFVLEGDGPHRWLWVEKDGANTDWAAGRLASVAGVKKRDVGFSGMKDRHAITRQWFSLPDLGEPVDWSRLESDGIRVLEEHLHRKKLKRGVHRANRFVITLRNVESPDDIPSRVETVREQGVPNYFGPQRFGRKGNNVIRALDGARGGIYLSAMRSYLFNAVAGERVSAGNWNKILPGELLQLDGSNSVFAADDDPALEQRLAEFDIHPTGPMWGDGDLKTSAEVATLEQAVAERYPELRAALERRGLKQERRSLRLPVRRLAAESLAPDCWRFEFSLPTGAFATSVLAEIINVRTPPGDQDA